jgi:cell wall-associated NlpC family hydrolase
MRPCLPIALLCLCQLGCGFARPAPRYTDSIGPDGLVQDLEKRRRAGQDHLLQVVDAYLGVPYQWGGTSRAGMDCSAFARAIFRETYGIELPRTSGQMYRLGSPVIQQQDLRPGDLVFFRDTYAGPGISHVGVYLGDGRFAHASSTQGGTITTLDTPYFHQRYAGARRIGR